MTTDSTHHAPSESNVKASFSDVPVTDNSLMIDMSTQPMITDPLFILFSRTLTIRELVRLKAVCKTFATLVSDNMQLTAEARCEDDTKDWYFPLRFDIVRHKPAAGLQGPWIHSWTWSGFHHSSGRILRLPSLTHLPRDGIDFDDNRFDCLLANAGGLLLFIKKEEIQSPSRPRAAWVSKHTPSQNWRPLLVSNPLTKQWRLLPAVDSGDVGVASWNYGGARAHMVVDEKANVYKLILCFRDAIAVYKSASNSWSSRRFPESMWQDFRHPQSLRLRQILCNRFVTGPSAIVGGKLYLAELEVDEDATPVSRAPYGMVMLRLGHVSVSEVDDDACTWKPPIRYPLRNYFLSDLHDHFWDYGFSTGIYTIGMAECMGGMYIIIPAGLNIELPVGDHTRRTNGLHDKPQFKSYDDFGYLPLRFYILQLQGVGLPFGQLLIQIPHGTPPNEHLRRKTRLWDHVEEGFAYLRYPSKSLSWFQCSARGSVIWVAFEDYLLQYDVVSGQSTTQIFPDTSFRNQPDLSYRPSVHMKP